MKYAVILVALAMSTMMSCSSSKETVTSNEPTEVRGERGQRQGGPDIDKIFAEMDANDDGKIMKLEAKGPIAENFDKMDSNDDGYITKEELQSAPRPERGERGGRGGRGGGRN